jgi:signal transduction histidine kinase
MARWTNWLIPALLAAAQLAVWPGLKLGRGELDPVRVAAVVAIVAVVAGALGFRRRSPVAVSAVVAAGLGLGTWVLPGQEFFAPADALLVLTVADFVALFSVAVRCSRRTTFIVLAALVVWQSVLLVIPRGFTADYPWDLASAGCLYALVAAAGRIRGRTVAERTAAARRLAGAEQARLQAAEGERRRLARELHDVTAHHLTSIVVNASAAQFVGAQRPELRAEALGFAARTGRETLVALHRLVEVLPGNADLAADAVPSLADLADDFRHLGQVVEVETTGAAPPGVAAVLHGIAREAMTNTLRYAPGGTVRLRCTYGPAGAELIVEDDGPAAPSAAAGLGGGRGLTGMRERAAALGGTVEAGPRRTGPGWRVRAVLPPAGEARRLRRRLGSHLVLDAGLALLTLVVPLSGVAVLIDEGDPAPAAVTLILLATLAHAAPLLWRRQHPWTVLAVVLLTGWFGPLLAATDVTPADESWMFLFSFAPALVAVYTVAARGARPGLTWLAPVLALISDALAVSVLVALEPPDAGQPPLDGPVMVLLMVAFVATLAAVALSLPVAGSWLAGHAARRRRQRRHDREEGAVATATAEAAWRAGHERARIAAGLRTAVLEHAGAVPRAAEAQDLAAVVDSARAALTAMRGLLDGLGTRDAPPPPGLVRPPAGDRTEEVPSSSSG